MASSRVLLSHKGPCQVLYPGCSGARLFLDPPTLYYDPPGNCVDDVSEGKEHI
jgi:hypothetical protein